MTDEELLKLALEREKKARKEAERILEQKSLELYQINNQLAEANISLESRIAGRTAELQIYASRLETLIGNLQAAILVEDQHRNIILTNQGFCDLFKIPAPPLALVGVDCSGSAEQSKHLFKNPEAFVSGITSILANKKPVLNEPLEMVDGTLLERDYVPIVFDNQYYGHLWKYSNVTEQAHVKEQLEFLARFPEENPAPIIRCTPNGTLLYSNQVGNELLGQLQTPGYEQHREELNKAIFHSYLHKERSIKEVSVANRCYNVNIIPIANKQYVNLYFNDITDRKRFQLELDKQKQFYETILNKIPTDIAVFDTKHRYTFVNPVAIKNKEIREWLIGKDDFEYCAYRNRDTKIAEERRSKFIRAVSNKEGIEWEDKVTDTEGKTQYIYRRLFPVFNERDELTIVIGFGIDITKVKQAEMRAEESSKAKEIFLANMSHEIRTPINGVLGLATLLSKGDLDPKQQNYIQLIRKSADNLLVIINDILDLAKVESGKIEIENVAFDINEICNQAVQSLRYKSDEKGIEILYRPLSFTNKFVSGDPFRLNQILLNLLNNAIKFTDNGLVELSVQLMEETLQTLTLQIRVKDSGIGIPSDKMETIFEEFKQGGDHISKRYGGTGLGLSICKKLVELQGGRIWVESSETNGSIFSFELTYLKADKPGDYNRKGKQIDKTSLGRKRVLLAEDNEINQFIAKSMMEDWGFEVHVADTGLKAMGLASINTYDIILMDIQMPEMNGVDATRLIRKQESQSKHHTPILALTANAIKGDKEKYLSEGMDDYLSKPFEEDELYYKIASLLQSPLAYLEQDAAKEPIPEPLVAKQFSLDKLNNVARGNKGFVIKMLQLFIDTTPELIRQLENALQQKDWQQLNAVAHKLKPTVQTMDIKHISTEVAQVEKTALSNPSAEMLEPMVDKIVKVLEACIRQAKVEMETMSKE